MLYDCVNYRDPVGSHLQCDLTEVAQIHHFPSAILLNMPRPFPFLGDSNILTIILVKQPTGPMGPMKLLDIIFPFLLYILDKKN